MYYVTSHCAIVSFLDLTSHQITPYKEGTLTNAHLELENSSQLIIDEHISEAYAQRLQSPNSSRERTEEGQTQQQSHCYLKVEEEGHTTPQKTTHPDKTARLRCANRPRHASTGM